MQMNDELPAMARHRYGYGRWNAPYWFLGLEADMDRGESDDLAAHRGMAQLG